MDFCSHLLQSTWSHTRHHINLNYNGKLKIFQVRKTDLSLSYMKVKGPFLYQFMYVVHQVLPPVFNHYWLLGLEVIYPLPPVLSVAIWLESILLAGQLQILILISPKMIMGSSQKWQLNKSIFTKFNMIKDSFFYKIQHD